MYVVLGFLFIKDKWYKVLVEATLISIIFIVYQCITMLYKEVNINIIVNDFITEKILSIDLYILLLLTSLRNIKKGDYIHDRWIRFLVVLSNKRRSKESLPKDQKLIQQESIGKQTTDELGYKLFVIILALFQFTLVGTLCYFINNVTWQFIVIFVSFVFMRKCFGKSYHANSVIVCTTLSCVVFVCATRLSLPPYISVLCNVLIGCLVAYMMYVMYYFIKYTTAQGVTIRRGMSKESLLEVCSINNLNEFETNLLIDFYCNKYSAVFLARKYGYSSDNIHKIKAKLLKRIRNS